MQNTSIAVAIERSQPRIIFADSHLGELALHLAELKPDRLEWVHLNVCSPLSVTVLKARDFKVTTHIGLSRSLTDSESRFLEMEEFLQQIGYLNTNGTAQKTTNEANDGFACFLAKLRDWARAST